ncbi:hypothetical protein DRN85_09645 [Methanosarcinales archaeon]|nr:MAG: hypothetical protein DRN85_09645 [Methanosarcinales archaeon]
MNRCHLFYYLLVCVLVIACSTGNTSVSGNKYNEEISILIYKGYECFKKRDYRNAKAYLKRAINHRGAKSYFATLALPYTYLGLIYEEEQDYEQSVKMFKKAVEQKPDSPMLHFFLGRCFFEYGDYESARKHLKRALEINPRRKMVHFYLGLTYLKLNKCDRAFEEFMHELKTRRKSSDIQEIKRDLQ